MAGIGGDATLFEDTFTITHIDDQKYDRVSRFTCVSNDQQTEAKLDVNIDLFPCLVGEGLHVVVATALSLDGSQDDEKGWRDTSKSSNADDTTLADMFDYVCHGRVYKFEDAEDGQQIKVFISFGGLLMSLYGPYKKLTPLHVGPVYLLVKK